MLLALMLIIAVGLAGTARVAADSGGRPFATTLTGEAEVTAGGVPNQGQGEVCWDIEVSGITLPATAAHIPVGPSTRTGPVVVPLSAPDANGVAAGCIPASRELIKAIIQDPSAYYVNVHNSDFPAGALRGQLSK